MFKNMKMNKAKRILKKRITIMLEKEISKEEITKKAEKVGWKKEIIDEIFKQIEEEKEIKVKIPFLKKKEGKPEEKQEIPEEEPEPRKKGLVGQLNEIKETLDVISQKDKQVKKLKKKKFKLPFKVKSQLKKLAVKDKVQVILLQRTKNIKPIIGDLKDGMLLVKGMVYNGSVDATWLWNGKIPTMIVPEWDLKPLTPEGIEEMKATSALSPQELMAYCLKFGRLSVPGKIIIRMVEAKANQMLTGKANMKTIILVVVITLIIAAVLFSSGVA